MSFWLVFMETYAIDFLIPSYISKHHHHQVMSDTKVMLVQPNQAIDMVVNLCKRAKPR
jgi:hypothetical protein